MSPCSSFGWPVTLATQLRCPAWTMKPGSCRPAHKVGHNHGDQRCAGAVRRARPGGAARAVGPTVGALGENEVLDDEPRARTLGAGLVDRLAAVPGREGRLATSSWFRRERPSADWPAWASADVVAAFAARGVERPWQHQAVAAEAAHAGSHVVLSTGTASGKSLAYQLPALTAIRRRGPRGSAAPACSISHPPRRWPRTSCAGSRARASTSARRPTTVTAAGSSATGPATTASTSSPTPTCCTVAAARPRSGGRRSSGSLRYVVVDECHHYRGVFGAHVAHVLRRLRRICAHYGAAPMFVLASATVAEPAVAAERLTGLRVLAGDRRRLAARAGLARAVGAAADVVRRRERRARAPGGLSETADLLADLVSGTSARWPSSARGAARSRSR